MTEISHFIIIKNKKLIVYKGLFHVNSHLHNITPMLWQTDITDDNVWIKDINWENYRFKISDNSIEKLDFNIGLNGCISNIIVIFKDNIQSCFSTIKNEVVVNFPKVEKINSYLSNEINIFFQVESTLKSLSLLTGEYEWEVDLGVRKFIFGGEEQEAKISQIIGVIDGNLYVWMSDERLVEIDVQTGKIKTETFPLQALQAQGIIQAVLFPQYYEKEQSLFFFYQDYLVQVHLPTQENTLIWQDSRYNIGPSFITDNFIYFIGNYQKGTVFRDHVGVFDRQKNEVVWLQQVITLSKETYNNLKEIQATDDKIYVLDTSGTLYIFERETEV
ncbi:hypothetical protein [Cellulophaga sp. BC115SP]|uniref:hypothetical protein n=1 Tax=Cellulophaga sp. BC115SP TaxID=2683263 RepID=UPI001412DAAE|nr:hypothetical protein [Cellulophaga sp. BC115SP]NBB31841.1 hypothetical protein [Cellulophaga sp. BC115SP]